MPCAATRPNIILILADDMGFSDLGLTGSEVRTPYLDSLARDGMLFSSMYNCARCCPTRAALLTGLYPHKAGIGHMGSNLGSPAYQGFLRHDSATIAEVLRANGYRTFMSGKWHVGGDFDPREVDDWRVGDVEHPTPRQRGFERFYGIVDGATHFFSPHYMLEDDSQIDVDPTDFYFTDAITDKAIEMIGSTAPGEAPFFLYLAHAAPHWPLHALPDDIARYKGEYHLGWDAIRTARHERMNALGVLQQPWEISLRDADAPPWRAAAHHHWEAMRMAAYAAMIDRMDQSIGRLVASLKARGQFEDTLILFLSDNGGCAEYLAEDGWAKYYPTTHLDGRRITMGNQPHLSAGDALTFMSYDLPWANVSNAPFRSFKHWVHEGGISTPLVAHWPRGMTGKGAGGGSGGRIHHEAMHVVDIAPTLFEVTGSPYLRELGGHALQALDGESFSSAFGGQNWQREQPIFWEHEGNCAIRHGQFKLVCRNANAWELYDMEKDRTEQVDLSAHNPRLIKKMSHEFEVWSAQVGVQPWDVMWPKLQAAWGLGSTNG